ncbi:MAG: 4-hydroxy-tetrahydrodipicolinate reductase [Actinobacteria bacterium]|nr:4-hydroxy-tetrahydrodipicolinate reductase [Actinomycetota bacterium]
MRKIAVFGVCGRMGSAITKELLKEKDIEIVGGFDRINIGKDIGEFAGSAKIFSTVSDRYEDIKALNPDILLDFTNSELSFNTINWAVDNSTDIIVGSTGFTRDMLEKIENKAQNGKSRVFIVPNFSIGAVIMMELAAIAAKYFDSCEIIEFHHNKKKDAPSGTAALTAEKIKAVKTFSKERLYSGESETLEGSRGAFSDGVHIHSVRLNGFLAHQEVIMGTTGQTLTIRHDSIDRLTFYPGVILAIRKINTLSNFTYGLDKIIEI